MDNKGQLNLIDLTIASAIILMLLFSIMEAWNSGIENLNEYRKVSKAEEKLSTLTKQLIDTTGSPPDWHLTAPIESANHVGLNGYGPYLTRKKIDLLSTQTYENFKQTLSLGGYDLLITITDLSNISQPIIYQIGNDTTQPSLKATRLGILDDNIVKVEVKLMGDIR